MRMQGPASSPRARQDVRIQDGGCGRHRAQQRTAVPLSICRNCRAAQERVPASPDPQAVEGISRARPAPIWLFKGEMGRRLAVSAWAPGGTGVSGRPERAPDRGPRRASVKRPPFKCTHQRSRGRAAARSFGPLVQTAPTTSRHHAAPDAPHLRPGHPAVAGRLGRAPVVAHDAAARAGSRRHHRARPNARLQRQGHLEQGAVRNADRPGRLLHPGAGRLSPNVVLSVARRRPGPSRAQHRGQAA
jgi:hypothetical protein